MTEQQQLHLIGDGGPNVEWPVKEEGALYLAGPVTGIAQFNAATFVEAKRLLNENGYPVVFNPVADTEQHDAMLDQERGSDSWQNYMAIGIRRLIEAHTIILLPGWANSRGAMAELTLATSLGMAVYLMFPSQRLLVQTSRMRKH